MPHLQGSIRLSQAVLVAEGKPFNKMEEAMRETNSPHGTNNREDLLIISESHRESRVL